jgi:hypothetical protein
LFRIKILSHLSRALCSGTPHRDMSQICMAVTIFALRIYSVLIFIRVLGLIVPYQMFDCIMISKIKIILTTQITSREYEPAILSWPNNISQSFIPSSLCTQPLAIVFCIICPCSFSLLPNIHKGIPGCF